MASALLKMWLKIILNPKGPANNGMKRQRATGRRMSPLRADNPLLAGLLAALAARPTTE